MTVETSTKRVQYATNGTTGPFTVPFKFLANADLEVIHTDAAGNETTLTLTTHYSVTGAGNPSGGTVTTVTAYAAGGYLTVLRDLDMTQQTDFSDGDALPAESLETALDRLTMLLQQVSEVADRALVFAPSDTAGSTLPAVAARADKLVGFNSVGVLTMTAPAAGTAAALALNLSDTASVVNGDALIGVKLTDVGAAAKTLHAYLQGSMIYALAFGAVGDGVTDDTSAIQAAITACATRGGGVVYLGPGTYAKTGVLTIPGDVILRGAGSQATKLQNTVANTTGVAMTGGARCGGVEDLTIAAKVGDATNIGLSFDTATGYAEGSFRNLLINGFQYGVNGGDECWENEFFNIRSNDAVSRAFRFIGVTGAGSDNLLSKCYANNVGAGAATGKSFEFSACMSKSMMLNCTFGDTASTENQLEVGTNVNGLTIVSGNCEGFALASGAAAVKVGSASTVDITGLVFQSVNGPGAGSAALVHVADSAIVNVRGCVEMGAPTGTLYSLRVGAATARLSYGGNRFVSLVDSAVPNGPQIIRDEGVQVHTTQVAVDLSGAAATRYVVNLPNAIGYLISAKLVYTEASSADAGILLQLGYSADTDFLASVVTEVSKALWSTTAMTILDRRIGGWPGPILLTSPGGKVGTGEVVVVLEYTLAL